MGLTLFTSHNWHYWQAKRLYFRYSLAFIGGWGRGIQRLESYPTEFTDVYLKRVLKCWRRFSVALHPCQDNDKEEEGVRSARRIRNQAATNHVHSTHSSQPNDSREWDSVGFEKSPAPGVCDGLSRANFNRHSFTCVHPKSKVSLVICQPLCGQKSFIVSHFLTIYL